MSDSDTVPDSPDPGEASRNRFYRIIRREPDWAIGIVIPSAMGTLRSLAEVNHRDQAQDRAREALEWIDAEVMAKGKELGLWHD